MEIDPKLHPSSRGEPMHFSVGAIIESDQGILLLDRVKPRFGFACPSGHIGEWENRDQALFREVKFETNLEVVKSEVIIEEEVANNTCSRGVDAHYWFVFQCRTRGDLNRDPQHAKSLAWYTPKEIKRLPLERMWKYWLKKAAII